MNTLSDGYPHLVGVDNWEQNQISFKPDANATLHGNRVYAYDSGPSNNPYPLGERCFLRDVYPPFYQRQVTDIHESMSHVAPPRSKAIGAEPNSSVVFATSIDLAAQYGFARARSDHSGQFERRIQQVHDSYTSIVDELK